MAGMRPKYDPNVFDPHCPSRRVLDILADKWAVLIFMILSRGTRRHNQLMREVAGISQKMLTQTLRQLECYGLVQRKVYPVIPPKVEYSLTSLGKSLVKPVSALGRWAEEHLDEVADAYESYQKKRS